MKAYLMSIHDSIKGINDKINVKTLLCNKSWIVFNDEGLKIVFIFQRDGSLIISQNGVVTKSKWDYIKANKAILVEDNNQQILLLHPTFVDDVLFVLQQDGTESHIVMIDETKVMKFMLITIEAINNYLNKVNEEQHPQEDQVNEDTLLRILVQKEYKEEIEQATRQIKVESRLYYTALLLIFVLSLGKALCA